MLRSYVNQRILDLYRNPTYLEIGVDGGDTFHAIRAARKVGVDPAFRFDVEERRAGTTREKCEYVDLPSDAYFSTVNKREETFDVIFIDGLHTFDQTLRDLLNATMCLKENGVIIVDDVYPTSYPASLPDLALLRRYNAAIGSEDWTWMGDVYRLVSFVEDYLPLFSYATVAENHGQMVMWHEPRPNTGRTPKPVEAICRIEYIEAVLGQERFNLMPFAEIEALLKKRPGSRGFVDRLMGR